jgi:predicted dehydrogenase
MTTGPAVWSNPRQEPAPPVKLAFLGSRSLANLEHAAKVPGFQIVAAGDLDMDRILADRSIDAVCIAVLASKQADLTIRACQAGKDVYLETPAFEKLEEGPPMVEAARRYGRVVQAGTALRSGAGLRNVREIVRSGELGDIAFCRITGGHDPMPLIDLAQFLFDEATPVSLDAQSGAGSVHITFRYPGFVASYQASPGPWAVSIHGTEATISVNRSVTPHLAHWKDFLDCIRTRRRPVSDIETCVRSTTACLRAGLAMRRNWRVV